MKLRFVKFLTSRENEIEKKEKEDEIPRFATTQLGRDQSPVPLPLSSLYHFRSLPPSAPPARALYRPSFPSATGRKSDVLQLSFPQLFCFFPLLLHKITEAEERGGRG